MNERPIFLSSSKLQLVKGEQLEFQFDVNDPEGRALVYSLSTTDMGIDSNVTDSGIWSWSVPTIEGVYMNFTFHATDECGAQSDPYTPVIEVKDCGCPHGEPCLPDPDYPRGLGHYICNCIAGYTGKHCEMELDECTSNPCVSGTCLDVVNGFQCVCGEGFTGYQCEQEIDECASNPCFLSIKCTDQVAGFSCGPCPDGYQGDGIDCTGYLVLSIQNEVFQSYQFPSIPDVDECETIIPCQGVCSNYLGGYKCGCLDGYRQVTNDTSCEGRLLLKYTCHCYIL